MKYELYVTNEDF